MTIAVFGRTELRCSVFVLLLFPLAVVFDRLETLLIAAGSLIVHELSHSVMAHRLGFSVSSIELQPFGCVARLKRAPLSPSESAAIAAAGPLVSLILSLTAAGAAFLSGGTENSALSELSFFNLTLGLVNLLPVLPLDGGRLALAAVSSVNGSDRRKAASALSIGGVAIGLIVAAIGAFSLTKKPEGMALFRAATTMVTGAFIVLSAAAERKELASHSAKARLAAESNLRSGRGLRVYSVAMHKKSTVREALMAVSGTGYGVVLVVDDGMRMLSVLDEGRLVAAAVRGGSGEKLENIVNS
ncbi:MAG: site-2 protease family protein [Clostridia bacterium]|nr:site-2 protease family protein [Clostridia bacterium]